MAPPMDSTSSTSHPEPRSSRPGPDAVTPHPFASPPPESTASPDSETIRRWRTHRVRRQIQSWLYDEEAGLEAALDKLARDLGVTLVVDRASDQPDDQKPPS